MKPADHAAAERVLFTDEYRLTMARLFLHPGGGPRRPTAGFAVHVIACAVRPVAPEGGRKAAAAMQAAGTDIIDEQPEERAA